MLYSSVALSVALSFICSEFIGLLSGGMVSCGYLAYHFHEPVRIVSTIALSVLITLAARLLDKFIFLYGRRRFMLNMLLSILFVWVVQRFHLLTSALSVDMRVIGFMIPGLIANDMEKQGILKTIAAIVVITAVVVLFSMLGL